MLKKLRALLGITPSLGQKNVPATADGPYNETQTNRLYNLLFCDKLELYRTEAALKAGGAWAELLSDSPSVGTLQAIAGDETGESRIRALAYNRMRAMGEIVATKRALAVIIEVPLESGLDTLAAYGDGSVRYLNHTGRVGIFEGGPPNIVALAKDLVEAGQRLIEQIGPWDKERLPAPHEENVRITCIVSDGLYFGEGEFEMLQKDQLGGPVLANATALLLAVTAPEDKKNPSY